MSNHDKFNQKVINYVESIFEIPSTKEFCDNLYNLVRLYDRGYKYLSAGDRLSRLYAFGNSMYKEIERKIYTLRVREIYIKDVDEHYCLLDSLFSSKFQASKSRGGTAFEIFFSKVATEYKVPFQLHPKNIKGRIDVIFPNETTNLPLDKLRTLELKSTSRERWKQAIANQHGIKHNFILISGREDITREKISDISAFGLIPITLGKTWQETMSLEEFFVETREVCGTNSL